MKRLIITLLRGIANRLDGIKNRKLKYVALELGTNKPLTEAGPLMEVAKKSEEQFGKNNYIFAPVLEKDVTYILAAS